MRPTSSRGARRANAPEGPSSGPAQAKLGRQAESPIPVSRLPRRLSHHLGRVTTPVWLEGAIANLRWSGEGHLRFTLRDGATQLECVAWRKQAASLRSLLVGRHGDGGASTAITQGDAVVVFGTLSLDPNRVTVCFIVADMRRKGVSPVESERELARQRLQRDGLLAPSRKKRLPKLPRLIALITSAGSAAQEDVLSAARRRHPGIGITVVPAPVQGEGAPRALMGALARAARLDGCDVILLCRGGGGAGELAPFDDEALARAVAASPIPVVTGIGHETDTSLVDCVADVRAATPTAAAIAVVPIRAELEAEIGRLKRDLAAAMSLRVTCDRVRAERATTRMAQGMALRVDHARRSLDRFDLQVRSAPSKLMSAARVKVERVQTALQASMRRTVDGAVSRRKVAAAELAGLGPAAILGRGYSVAHGLDGSVLVSAGDFSPGGRFRLQLQDGDVDAQAMGVRTNTKSDGNT